MAQSGTVRVVAYLGAAEAVALSARAKLERRSVSAMAALLLSEALGEEDLGSSQSSAGSPAPGGAVGSSSPSVEVLGEGDPSGVSGDGLVSDPADAKAPSRATAASSPSPSTTAFVSGLLAREPKKGECPRVLQHRKGEFCKSCNEMIT